jgi:hypothetical protein
MHFAVGRKEKVIVFFKISAVEGCWLKARLSALCVAVCGVGGTRVRAYEVRVLYLQQTRCDLSDNHCVVTGLPRRAELCV